jgi:hypothetical protein
MHVLERLGRLERLGHYTTLVRFYSVLDASQVFILAQVSPCRLYGWYRSLVNRLGVGLAKLKKHLTVEHFAIQLFRLNSSKNFVA